MKEHLPKMTIRHLSLWLMVMLDPAYKMLYLDQFILRPEYKNSDSVDYLLHKSIDVFEGFLSADPLRTKNSYKQVQDVMNAANHLTHFNTPYFWIGTCFYLVMLGLESILNSLDYPDEQIGHNEFLHAWEVALKKNPAQAYHDRLLTLATDLTSREVFDPQRPFGQPLVPEYIRSVLKDTYFDLEWRENNKPKPPPPEPPVETLPIISQENPQNSLTINLLAIVSLILVVVPPLGLVVSLVVLRISKRARGWPRILAWTALVFSLFLLLDLILLFSFKNALHHTIP